MSIATAINGLSARIQGAYAALKAKAPSKWPANQDTAGLSAAIASIPAGSAYRNGTTRAADFIDADGTLLYSYTWSQISAMTELPPLPTRLSKMGISCVGWNYTLDEVKAAISSASAGPGFCDVGAVYRTTDGATNFRMYLPETTYNGTVRLRPTLERPQSGNGSLGVLYNKDYYLAYDFSKTGTVVSEKIGYTTPGYVSVQLSVCPMQDYPDDKIRWNDYASGLSTQATYVHAYQNRFIHAFFGDDTAPAFGPNAMRMCRSLSCATLPPGISSIEERAFSVSGIRHFTIPNGVTAIGQQAFNSCRDLETVSIPESVISVAPGAFAGCCSLKRVRLPSGLQGNLISCFQDCRSLQTLYVPNGVTALGGKFAYDCQSLKSVRLPPDIQAVSTSAFQGCISLGSIEIPEYVTSIGSYAFTGCVQLTRIAATNSVSAIGDGVFANCDGLMQFGFPNFLTDIRAGVLSGCNAITITFASYDAKNVRANAFNGCSSCRVFDFTRCEQIPALASTNAFSNTPDAKKIVVPDGLYTNWRKATNWASLSSVIIKESTWDEM